MLKAGANVTVVGLEAGNAETVNNDLDPAGLYAVDTAIRGASASDYDRLVIPGDCVGADKLRASKEEIAFFFAEGKPVGLFAMDPGHWSRRMS